MSAKIEARRFSGKPGTWPAYEMACNSIFAIAKIKKYLIPQDKLVPQTGEGAADELQRWKDAQQEIYRHFTLHDVRRCC